MNLLLSNCIVQLYFSQTSTISLSIFTIMLRSTIRSSLMFRRAAPAQIRAYSEGATGAPRNDGGDSFTVRTVIG